MTINNAAGNNGVFSANVQLHLYVGEQRIELGQLGPGFAILRERQEIFAHEGDIETIVDGKINRWPVKITSPITGKTRKFTFESIG